MNNWRDAATVSPLRDGYRWPAEWETHCRTWMCWPTRLECFGGEVGSQRAKQAHARVACAISAFEPVTIAVRSRDAAEARLATGGKVEIVEMPIDDSWARDSGPLFLKNAKRGLCGVQWVFNGWGQKYQPFADDAVFARRVAEQVGVPVYNAPLVCEGGALHGDGEGTVLTTEQCLLNPNRNPGRSKAEVEEVLKSSLGARKVIWLPGTFSDSETDGHIDNIACFAGPGRVLLGMPAASSHPDSTPVREALQMLKSERDAKGRALEIIALKQPEKPRPAWSGQPLAASYVNFYLVNGAVIMPAFDDVNDAAARDTLAQCFPGRDIVQIDALDIVQGGGGIHCITQQEPEG